MRKIFSFREWIQAIQYHIKFGEIPTSKGLKNSRYFECSPNLAIRVTTIYNCKGINVQMLCAVLWENVGSKNVDLEYIIMALVICQYGKS